MRGPRPVISSLQLSATRPEADNNNLQLTIRKQSRFVGARQSFETKWLRICTLLMCPRSVYVVREWWCSGEGEVRPQVLHSRLKTFLHASTSFDSLPLLPMILFLCFFAFLPFLSLLLILCYSSFDSFASFLLLPMFTVLCFHTTNRACITYHILNTRSGKYALKPSIEQVTPEWPVTLQKSPSINPSKTNCSGERGAEDKSHAFSHGFPDYRRRITGQRPWCNPNLNSRHARSTLFSFPLFALQRSKTREKRKGSNDYLAN